MKNRIIFIIGLILLIGTVWASTMIGIKLNKRALDKSEAVCQELYLYCNNFTSFDENCYNFINFALKT